MHWYDWVLLAITIGVGGGAVWYVRAATNATRRELRRMVFPLVDRLLQDRDDAADSLPKRGP
jgi:hypothetical protein